MIKKKKKRTDSEEVDEAKASGQEGRELSKELLGDEKGEFATACTDFEDVERLGEVERVGDQTVSDVRHDQLSVLSGDEAVARHVLGHNLP